MERTTHPQAIGDLWTTKNLHLSFSEANILFISAIVIDVFFTVWMTRGIHKYADMTECCRLAIGMSVVALLYFAIANATLVGIKINTIDGRCDVVARLVCVLYLVVKAYTGVFLFKKISEMLKPKLGRKARRVHAKGAYYFVFGPLVLIFIACAVLMLTCIQTSVQYQAKNKSFCIIHTLFPKIILPIFTFSTLITASMLSLSFVVPSRLLIRQVAPQPSTRACIASIITAAIPFVFSIYLFTMDGNESASLVNCCFGFDVMVALCAVWYVEGVWTEDRIKGVMGRECKCDKRPSGLQPELGERDDVMGSRVARMGTVKKLHLQLEMDLLQTRSLEDVEDAPSGPSSG